MSTSSGERLAIAVDGTHRVSALFDRAHPARALLVLAHGAGAGMEHPSIESLALGLAERGIATLRYQFPYMERKSRRPDPPALCHATVRAAVKEAGQLAPELPLLAGGRSFGGRMTSQAQAQAPLPHVRGLVFFAFPLHPAGQLGTDRAKHLSSIDIPMLFIQGTRDELAQLDLLRPLVAQLGGGATLHAVAEADHALHVPARSGRKDPQVREELLECVSEWVDGIVRSAHS